MIPFGQATGQHHVANRASRAHVGECGQLWMHQNDVDPERLVRCVLGGGNFGVQLFGGHSPRSQNPESAGV